MCWVENLGERAYLDVERVRMKLHLDVGDGKTRCGLTWRWYDAEEGVEEVEFNAVDDKEFVTCKRCLSKRGAR